MKRVALLSIFSVALLCACHDDRHDDNRAAVRQTTARAFQHLISGDVDAYLALTADYDSLPQEYQSQLHDLMLQHLHKDSLRHGTMIGAQIVGDSVFNAHRAEVYVELQWADSTRERIQVLLQKSNGDWRLK